MHITSRLLSSLLTSIQKRPFYVTTPIFYVNAAPHIGHVYTAIVADAIQRFEKLIDPNCRVIFATGTDEHGTKIQQAAQKHNKPLSEYCDSISNEYKVLFKEFGIEFTDFIRTTEDRHKRTVEYFWNALKSKGFLYKSQYSGWYSVNDESFLTESHLREEERNGQKVKISLESGHPVEWSEEENYMFRLSTLKDDLKYWLKKADVIMPSKYHKILQDQLHNDFYFPDISVSRPSSRVHWAIRVPDDPSQSIYVWLDALINYLTVIGYPDQDKMREMNNPWPADVQVIGKDILKFHGLYWPAFLMAIGLHPPRRLLCHGHWTVDGQKMSKSLNNVVDPRETLGGIEALRYFLLREATMHSDSNYSETKLMRLVNAELADTFGNLLNRCTGRALNPRQEFPMLHDDEFRKIKQGEEAEHLILLVNALPDVCYEYYQNFLFYKVVDSVIRVLHAANLFFENSQPWCLKKQPETQKDLDVILHVTMETLRISATILQPIIPYLSNTLLDKLQIPIESRNWVTGDQISWNSQLIYEPRTISAEKVTLFQRIVPDNQKKATVL